MPHTKLHHEEPKTVKKTGKTVKKTEKTEKTEKHDVVVPHHKTASKKKMETMLKNIEKEIEEIENLEILIEFLTSTNKPKKTAANKVADEVWADVSKINKEMNMLQKMKKDMHLGEPHYKYENLAKIEDAKEFKKVLSNKKKTPSLTPIQEEKLNEIIKMIFDEHHHQEQQHHQQQHHQQQKQHQQHQQHHQQKQHQQEHKPMKKRVKKEKKAEKEEKSSSWFM
jgi:hypothetical protein